MEVHVLRVFVNEQGKFGNPVGIVLDQKQDINPANRQTIATKIGFSESVFINDLDVGDVSIFNPKDEVAFAGHALVGTAFFISKLIGKPINFLVCRGGKVLVRQEGALTWIRASLVNTPPWNHKQLQETSSVENLSTPQKMFKEHTMIWSWLDESKGIIRARTFAPDWGIPEDEANGSGSMQLAGALGKTLEIHHGKGSIVYTKPAGEGFADVGGRVKEDKAQEISI